MESTARGEEANVVAVVLVKLVETSRALVEPLSTHSSAARREPPAWTWFIENPRLAVSIAGSGNLEGTREAVTDSYFRSDEPRRLGLRFKLLP